MVSRKAFSCSSRSNFSSGFEGPCQMTAFRSMAGLPLPSTWKAGSQCMLETNLAIAAAGEAFWLAWRRRWGSIFAPRILSAQRSPLLASCPNPSVTFARAQDSSPSSVQAVAAAASKFSFASLQPGRNLKPNEFRFSPLHTVRSHQAATQKHDT